MDYENTWDVVVIGGGPAGMMAAGTAAQYGAKVLLLEKNASLGKKLLITGGGRCNLTNAKFNTRNFLSKYKKSNKFLFSPFSKWGVKETIDFFEDHGMPTKIEAEDRVFPVTDSAASVWQVMVEYMHKESVSVLTDMPVVGFVKNDKDIEAVRLKNGKLIKARSFILATGGKSRPETGSTGEGFAWLRVIGHRVVEPKSSLVPITIKDDWVKKLKGTTIPEVKITTYQNDAKQSSKAGKVLFTHFGVSGPTILNMSKSIDELLKYGEVVIKIDLLPKLDHGQLNSKLQELFEKYSNKILKNMLSELVTKKLIPVIIKFSKIKTDTPVHSITREERMRLIETLKNLPMEVKGLLGTDKAIITSGGVSLEEVDFKSMSSRLYRNLYLVGDVLNIDRPSGGYSLQLCWTTGFVAGFSAAQNNK